MLYVDKHRFLYKVFLQFEITTLHNIQTQFLVSINKANGTIM